MMRTDDERKKYDDSVADRSLWQQCRMADAPEDEAARFLDLAAFADGNLDEDEADRVGALLAADPGLVADVRAARSVGGTVREAAGLDRIIARACAILPDAAPADGRVVQLAPRRSRPPLVPYIARWSSIAAALAVAGWLGFAMGSDASLALGDPRIPGDAGFLPELFDPATGFLRDLGEGLRT
jgi:hypothetical protein